MEKVMGLNQKGASSSEPATSQLPQVSAE